MQACGKSLFIFVACAFLTGQAAQVIILGGGVAGLSAAHELIERGFEVSVYDRQGVFGGKARSIPVPNSGVDGRPDLPGEHGFRFFPGFYRHLPNTMSRIPVNSGESVWHGMVNATKCLLARENAAPWLFPTLEPNSTRTFIQDLEELFKISNLNISKAELAYFLERIYVMITSCPSRWEEQYDQYTYWDFMHAGNLSVEYQRYLVIGITRVILAAKAEVSSMKTLGRTFVRLLESFTHNDFDRLLDGPTSDVWFTPWVKYLQSMGVSMFNNSTVTSIQFDGTKVTGVTINNGQQVTGDYYIFSMPADRLRILITDSIQKSAPSLANLDKLHVEWMNGLMYYLNKDESIVNGHIGFFDSRWALTAVSQQQFWPEFDLSTYGDGQTRGIMSVDISDWNAPAEPNGPANGKAAINCTLDEIKKEVWYQMYLHLPQNFPEDQSNVHQSWLDPDIIFGSDNTPIQSSEPLLVNYINTWDARPQATTEIPNMFIAADFVQTTTDVACMECANEAARRAVNGILAVEGRNDFCDLYDLFWPEGVELEQDADCLLYDIGEMPFGWDFPVPSVDTDPEEIWKALYKVMNR